VISALSYNCSGENKEKNLPEYGKDAIAHNEKTKYIFSVHPLHNSRRLFEVYQPLVDYINKNTTEFTIILEASTDYAHYEQKIMDRRFHFALPNPYQSVQAVRAGYKIFGKMGDDERFRGIVVVRKDSKIRSVNDLRGQVISFPSSTALAAAMMPKYYLKTLGLDVEKNAKCVYVGSQESSIMNVYLGQTKAGCTWPPPWESFMEAHPYVKDVLIVRWQTPPLINNGLVVRNDVLQEHLKIFSQILFGLDKTLEGKSILKGINLSHFDSISQDVYMKTVNTFVERYKEMFGALPGMGIKK
jgi:phosphonate transport system substrate-binding protein